MKIFPAIDLKDNSVVRLSQGDYNAVTAYSSNAAEVASGFINSGADHLHVVDLDGAKEGKPYNMSAVKEILSVGKIFTQIGGGIRDERRIADYLELGIDRVILGTIAVKDRVFVEDMVKKYGSHIAVGVDAKDERVAIHGWTEKSEINSFDFCRQMREIGVSTIIYTDISKDGMLKGCNIEAYKKLSLIEGLDIVASGGVSTLLEIEELSGMGLYGAIVGKAIYEGKLDLKEALRYGK